MTTAAAPFVQSQPPRLSEQIATARAAVIVRAEIAGDPKTAWAVTKILKDASGTVAVGKLIHPRPAPSNDARLALLISNADRSISATAISDEAAAYLASLPRNDDAVERRFRHAIDHLDRADPVIAADVFAELAMIDRAALEAQRARLPADVLRKLVDESATSGEQLGLYGYLLGLCGEPADAGRLRQRFLNADGFAGGADGLAAGYWLLAGEQGLATLETHVLLSEHKSPLHAAAMFEALRFFRDCEGSPFSRERLRNAACCGFTRPDTADLAIGYLVAGREWDALPRVIELLDVEDTDPTRQRAVQVMAVRYLLECRRDADTTPDNRVLAGNALSQISVTDPDLMRRATHLAGGEVDRR
ncbi:MAG: hypothetical protein M3552_18955 [Planctomycetota bacterium]|nr:hypothetical protein [Planctomycetota bacterium]